MHCSHWLGGLWQNILLYPWSLCWCFISGWAWQFGESGRLATYSTQIVPIHPLRLYPYIPPSPNACKLEAISSCTAKSCYLGISYPLILCGGYPQFWYYCANFVTCWVSGGSNSGTYHENGKEKNDQKILFGVFLVLKSSKSKASTYDSWGAF